MDIIYTVVPDERFLGRGILIGTFNGKTRYAAFNHHQEKAKAAIAEAFLNDQPTMNKLPPPV